MTKQKLDARKFLITGSNGQLATEFAKLFQRGGYNYHALTKEELNIADFSSTYDTLKRLKPDFIINCAAYNLVDKAEEDWQSAFLVNALGPNNLCFAASDLKSTLVHFSTDYVFNGQKGEPYTTSDSANPINTYGKSKLLGESLINSLNYAKCYIIRTSWVFGDGKNSFVTKLMEWMRTRPKLQIVDDQVSSPAYAEDLAFLTLRLLETENYGLYHLANSGYCARYEWADFIANQLGWRGTVEPVKSAAFDSPAKRPAFSALDISLSERILGEIPDWREATAKFLKSIS